MTQNIKAGYDDIWISTLDQNNMRPTVSGMDTYLFVVRRVSDNQLFFGVKVYPEGFTWTSAAWATTPYAPVYNYSGQYMGNRPLDFSGLTEYGTDQNVGSGSHTFAILAFTIDSDDIAFFEIKGTDTIGGAMPMAEAVKMWVSHMTTGSTRYFRISQTDIRPYTNTTPNTPTLTTPAYGTVTTDTRPILGWNALSDSNAGDYQSGYQVQMALDGAFTVQLFDSGYIGGGATEYQPPARGPGQWRWRVRVWDSVGQPSAWSGISIVEVNAAPNAPTTYLGGTDIGSAAVISSTTPVITWTYGDPDSDAQGWYQVLIYNSGGGIVHDSGKIAGSANSYQLANGVIGWMAHYQYIVRTWDTQDAASGWSVTRWIYTNRAPSAIITAPTGSAGSPTVYTDNRTPTITWNYSDPDGSPQQAVEIIVEEYGGPQVWSSGEVATTGNSYAFSAGASLSYDKTYGARIRAKDNLGTWGSYSAYAYFHFNRKSNAPTGLTPAGSAGVPHVFTDNLVPTLSWTFSDPDPTDAHGDSEFYLYDESGALILQQFTGATSYTIPAGVLLTGKTYRWRVRSRDNHATDTWGPTASDQYFHTNKTPNVPSNTSPAGGSAGAAAQIGDDLTPRLSWMFTDADGGDTQSAYQVRLYNQAGTLLYDSGEITGSVGAHDIPNANKLAYGLVYQWEVRAKDNHGVWSAYTSRAFIKSVMGAPTGVTATADNFAAQIIINWSDASTEGLLGWNVYRATSLAGTYTKINDTLLTTSNYTDSNITTGTTYYYKIEAYISESQKSALSAAASASANFSAWFIGEFKFNGPTKFEKKRPRIQSKRQVLGRPKKVVQDRGFSGDEFQIEIWLTDDAYSTGQAKYIALLTELDKLAPLSLRDPFGRTWKVVPGSWQDEQLLTGKLEYAVTFDLTEVN